jgi:two-component system, sensor histidine kinase and response regulator
LVELMAGKLDVRSRVGRGSTFSFTLRLPKGDVSHARKRAEELDLTGHSVLIVYDNDTNRKLMVMQLAPTRIGMDVAGNAISAIEMLRQAARLGKPFTMAMPGIDGMQLAEAIRNDPNVPQLPVSLASSLGTRPSLSELAEADVFRWLSKPLASSRLLQVVHDMASLRNPKQRVQEPPEQETASLTLEDLGSVLQVLVAEDNEINRRVIIGMLKRIGCQVTFAVDGREAVQLAKQREFALILMDCQMPEMDGFEATRAIRALGGVYADLPILALTANVLPADREACMAAGMNDFLPKPVKLDLLRSAINRWGRAAPMLAGLHGEPA